MPSSLEELLSPVLGKFSTAKLSKIINDELLVTIAASELYPFMEAVKKDIKLFFDHVSLVTAVDWLDRFDVIYKIYSYKNRLGLEVKASVSRENPTIASVASLWVGADWQEREVFDLYGIVFEGHPNLKRLLVADDFPGYPFRKDYPLENNEEVVLRESNRLY